MMQPEEICEELVPQIVATGEEWFFFFGSRKDLNFDADDKTDSKTDDNGQIVVTFPATVLQKPVGILTTEYKSGYAEATASLFMMFLYDPDQDETREFKQTLTKKARLAAREFVKRLKGFTTHIASVGNDRINDVEDIFNRKCWGVSLEVDIAIKNVDGECLTNDNNDVVRIIDQDGNIIDSPPCRTDYSVTVFSSIRDTIDENEEVVINDIIG